MKPRLNRSQAIGLTLITVALATILIPSSWVAAYWDTVPVDTYEGYDIYFIPAPNVYAIDTGGPASEWSYSTTVQGTHNKIDLWNDGPILVEQYRDFTLYQIPGYKLFYAERDGESTVSWDSIEKLKAYIDGEFYATKVYTIHGGGEEYLIYRMGYYEPVYWGELDGYKTPEFSVLSEAKQFIRERVKELELVDETTETTCTTSEGDTIPMVPVQEEPISGSTNPEETCETVGSLLSQQRIMISAILGFIGTGCLLLGNRGEEE